jgi:hypothetical protein
MGKLKIALAIVIGVLLIGHVGIPLATAKQEFVVPLLGDCPSALSTALNLFYGKTPEASSVFQQVTNVVTCGAGLLLFLLIPGIWKIGKVVLKIAKS